MSETAGKVANGLFSGGEFNNGGREADWAFNQIPTILYTIVLTLMVDFTEQHSVNEDNMKSCGLCDIPFNTFSEFRFLGFRSSAATVSGCRETLVYDSKLVHQP